MSVPNRGELLWVVGLILSVYPDAVITGCGREWLSVEAPKYKEWEWLSYSSWLEAGLYAGDFAHTIWNGNTFEALMHQHFYDIS